MTQQKTIMNNDESWKSTSSQDTLQPFPLESLTAQTRLKINFNSMGLELNGGNRVILELARRLHAKGHEVSITAIGREEDTQWFGNRWRKGTLCFSI